MLQRPGMPQGPMVGGTAPFIPGMPQSGQQQLPPTHMGMPPNANPVNQAMMNNMNNQANQQFLMQQQQQQQRAHEMRQRQMAMQGSGQPGRQMMGSGGPQGGAGVVGGPQQMAGMVPNAGMGGFNPAMMGGPNAVRRVSSQPNLNQGPGGPMSGMSPSMPNMNMNGQPMPGQVSIARLPPPLQQQALRVQAQNPHQNMAGAMGDMAMGMNRNMSQQGPMPGGPGRAGSTQPPQLMGSLSQPPSFPQQMPPPQNQFPGTPGSQPSQMSSPARAGSHTPSMSASTPGPSHPPANRQSISDDPMAFMGLGNQPFNRPPQNHQMQPTTNGNPFPNIGGPSSSPSIPNSDPQSMPSGMMSRGPFLTPAQQFEQMNNFPGESGNPNHFSMGPPPIPRPPSQHNAPTPHSNPTPQQHAQMRHSPHPPPDGHHNPHPPRPQSQNQNQNPSVQRPPSRQPQTPRSAHPQPPTSGPSQGGRPGTAGSSSNMPPPVASGGPQGHPMQMQNQGLQPGQRPGPQPLQMNPLPQSNVAQAVSNNPSQPPAPPGVDATASTSGPGGLGFEPARVIGSGQGLMRLLQFSGALASEDAEVMQKKTGLKFWDDLMIEYFTQKALMKFTLWKDSQRSEAKPFNITVPILSRFFLVTTQSGVKSMNLSLDGARERLYSDGHSIIECVGAIWTYKYHNGYSVTLRGPLTAHVIIHIPSPNDPVTRRPDYPGYVLKFDNLQFEANFYDKYVLSDAIAGPRAPVGRSADQTPNMNGPMNLQQREEEEKKWEEPRIAIDRASIPGEPINAFGIPQATMRCLELAESVSHMEDLIAFSSQHKLGPLDALQKFAAKVKEQSGGMFPRPMMNGTGHSLAGNDFNPMHINHMPITLYSSAPPSVTNPQSIGTPSSATANTSSPQNAPLSASNSPQKQHKTIPQGTPMQAPATSPAVSSGATNTPAMTNTTLKRKGGGSGDATSPSTGEPATKRQARRRRGTNTAGGS